MKSQPEKARYVSAEAEDADQRIDNFLLRHLKGVPKSHVYRLLRTGQVRVNKGRIKPGYRLMAGDSVRLPPVRVGETPVRAGPSRRLLDELDAAILYEGSHLLALNKPAGLAVHGGSGLDFGVIEALRALRPEAPMLELIHRLDRETSGCLLIAKRRSMLRAVHAMLREGRVEKRYLTLVAGRWRRTKEIRLGLEKNRLRGGERMVSVSEGGKESVSRFKPLAWYPGATLVEVELLTGRTHQIRVHAAQAGHPVLGDEKYGDRQASKAFRARGLKRMFLHAQSIAFTHPTSGEPMEFTAPLDEALSRLLAEWDKSGNQPA